LDLSYIVVFYYINRYWDTYLQNLRAAATDLPDIHASPDGTGSNVSSRGTFLKVVAHDIQAVCLVFCPFEKNGNRKE
jgi:hypothetical protein